jgi:hypothetical protein
MMNLGVGDMYLRFPIGGVISKPFSARGSAAALSMAAASATRG